MQITSLRKINLTFQLRLKSPTGNLKVWRRLSSPGGKKLSENFLFERLVNHATILSNVAMKGTILIQTIPRQCLMTVHGQAK